MGRDDSRSRSKGRKESKSRSRSRSAKGDKGDKGDKSRSRSRSRSGSDKGDKRPKKPDDYGVDTIKITDDDAAFILGKGGKTKAKVAKVAEAEIELFERDLVLEFRGSKLQRKRARKYSE